MTFSTAKQDADSQATQLKHNSQMQLPAYRLAYHDFDFMIRDELRPVRLQLELLKPELAFAEHGIGLLKQKYIKRFHGPHQLGLFHDLKQKHDPYHQFFPQGFMGKD